MNDTDHRIDFPPRRSWFAVWNWKRWAWTTVVAAVFAVYFLSPMPVLNFVARRGVPQDLDVVANRFYLPLVWLFAHSEFVQQVYLREWLWMDRQFGPPQCEVLFCLQNKRFYINPMYPSDDGLQLQSFARYSGRAYSLNSRPLQLEGE